MAKVLISDNGPHSPEKWATATAEEIFDIAPTVIGHRLMQAKRLQLSIAEALVPHHASVQKNERDRLAKDVQHIHTPHDAEEYMDQVMAAIVAASSNTPWEEHFARRDVQDVVRQIIANHFMTAQHIERLWHADRNPNCEVSAQYKARYHG